MKTRIEGIDYLRAFMSIFVVAWHMGGGGRSLIFSKDRYLEHVFTVTDFVNFHLLLLAVPTFIFISIYLYAKKPIVVSTLKKRLARILILLIFWPIAAIICSKGYPGLIDFAPNSSVDFVYKALRAGNTVYYFFTSLIICTIISHLFLLLNRKLQLSAFLVSIVMLTLLPQLTIISGFYTLSAYWNPLNFIPLSFTAALLSKNEHTILENRNRVLLLSIILCVLFSIFEWKHSVGRIFFLGQAYAIPAYTRTSLLFAVFFIFVLALRPSIKSNTAINFMARYSLSLYCLHPFLIRPVMKFISAFVQNKIIGIYTSVILVVVFSYFIAIILKKYILREELIM